MIEIVVEERQIGLHYAAQPDHMLRQALLAIEHFLQLCIYFQFLFAEFWSVEREVLSCLGHLYLIGLLDIYTLI